MPQVNLTLTRQDQQLDKSQAAAVTIFVSYAREDLPLVRRLVNALKERGHEVWVDLEGIPPSAPWRAEIHAAITGADAFVAVVSSSFLASTVCAEELAYAVSSSKRLVPVVVDPSVSSRQVPPALAELNWLHLDTPAGFADGVERLDEVLRTDLDRRRLHAGLLVQARRWEDKSAERSLLLRGAELTEAENWLTDRAGTIPTPLPEHTRFIVASRRAASQRGRTVTGTALLVVVALAVLAGVAYVQRNNAVQQQRVAISRQLVAQAEAGLAADPRTALQLNEAAYRISPGNETAASLVHDLTTTRYAGALDGRTGVAYATAFAPGGRYLATGGTGTRGTVALWDLDDPARRAHTRFGDGTDWVRALAFSPDGRTLVTRHDDWRVFLWDVASGTKLAGPLEDNMDTVGAVAFSPDGTLATADDDGTVLLWDITDRAAPRRIGKISTPGEVLAVAFSPDGRTLATGSYGDEPLGLWDITDRTHPRSVANPSAGRPDRVFTLAFSPDGRTLAAGGDGGSSPLGLWDVADPASPRRVGDPLAGQPDLVRALAYAPDGRTRPPPWRPREPTRPRPWCGT